MLNARLRLDDRLGRSRWTRGISDFIRAATVIKPGPCCETGKSSIGAKNMMLVRQIGIRLGPVLFYKQTGATSRFHLWNQAPDLVNVEICRTMDEQQVGSKAVLMLSSFGEWFGSSYGTCYIRRSTNAALYSSKFNVVVVVHNLCGIDASSSVTFQIHRQSATR
jgi:hypothetical protein